MDVTTLLANAKMELANVLWDSPVLCVSVNQTVSSMVATTLESVSRPPEFVKIARKDFVAIYVNLNPSCVVDGEKGAK